MDDVIYRKEAIDELLDMYSKVDDDGYMWVIRIDAVKRIEAMLSAQQWILCSERLPDINEEALTCDNDGTQRVHRLIRISDDEVGWEDDYGFYQDLEDVEAWMPLPEPYKRKADGRCDL